MRTHLTIRFSLPLAFALLLLSMCSMAQDRQAIAGNWVINTDLSDNTDSQVAKALRAMGEKVSRCWLRCEEDRFRGGPKEQELYDRISYDKGLLIKLGEQEYLFTYDDNYRRPVFTDGRSQSVSLTGLDNVEDFSFAHWEGNSLLVEARPRDGGFANEIYTLIDEGTHLRVEMYIQPRSFDIPLEIVRIYHRVVENN
ncbi:MAG: hypothetical protein P8M72_06070 [Gammaproteobacteria bacterium]|nr:hypothetical protein [Gammaproteobacteria bacterium]